MIKEIVLLKLACEILKIKLMATSSDPRNVTIKCMKKCGMKTALNILFLTYQSGFCIKDLLLI